MGNADLKLGIAERMNKQENEAKFVKRSHETKRESTLWETKIKEKKPRKSRS
jgi:hypothetical protein